MPMQILTEPLHRSRWDSVADFNIERTATGGLTKPNEWRQIMLEHRTRRLRIAVIFPE